MLGTFAATVDGKEVPLSGRQEPTVLAYLAVHRGRPVAHYRLSELLWPGEQPETVARQISNLMSRLKGKLKKAGFEALSNRNRTSTLTDVDTDVETADHYALKAKRASREGDSDGVADQAGRFLDTVPDHPLEAFDGEEFRAESQRLQGLAEEMRYLVAAALGAKARWREAQTVTSRLIESNPYSGKAVRLHMKALHFGGDKARALAVFDGHRERLAEEMGVDPDPETRELHTAVLREELPPEGEPEQAVPVPRELPAKHHGFVGRDGELEQLEEVLTHHHGHARVALLNGPGGMGKSALAVEAAHRIASAFPDGELYIDLRGHTPGMEPLDTTEALQRLIRSLGGTVSENEALEETAARFRTAVGDKAVLLVLDNASDTEQIRHLLPGSERCAVLVTSRRPLAILDACCSITLQPMDSGVSRRLLESILASSRAADFGHLVGRVEEACSGMPLALGIAGAKCRSLSARGMARLAAKLESERQRLSALELGDLAVRASVAAGLDELWDQYGGESTTVRTMMWAGLFPGNDFSAEPVAAMAGSDEEEVEDALEELREAQLVEEFRDRWRLHDLVRLVVREEAEKRLGEDAIAAGYERLRERYETVLEDAVRLEYPSTWLLDVKKDGANAFADETEAREYLVGEIDNMVALLDSRQMRDMPAESAVRFARLALRATYPIHREDLGVSIASGAAERLAEIEEPRSRYDVLNGLAVALKNRDDFAGAAEAMLSAIPCVREDGSARMRTHFLVRMAMFHYKLDDVVKTEILLRLAEPVAEREGMTQAFGTILQLGSRVSEARGLTDEAVRRARSYLRLSEESGHDRRTALAKNNLAYRLVRAGQAGEAWELFSETDEFYRALGKPGQLDYAEVLWGMGECRAAEGMRPEAREHKEAAVSILFEAGKMTDREYRAFHEDEDPAIPAYLSKLV
ncbi:AfsR/SARP family transcriptional regulator [Salininema proteolyticum]|uniref:BTAD domain-containing putative transcriptional regulator n=1 Tax=Salininema proteolyticum TaxID=1607685 RepID=A0ABV8U1W1_9ACTN